MRIGPLTGNPVQGACVQGVNAPLSRVLEIVVAQGVSVRLVKDAIGVCARSAKLRIKS
jgi:hypothetical protein